MDSKLIWRNRPITELSFDELIDVIEWCASEIKRTRDERNEILNQLLWKSKD